MVGILYFSSFLLAGFAYYSYFCKQNITYDLYSRLMKYYQYAIVGLILLLCGSLSATAADVDKHSQGYLSQRIDTIYSYFRKIDLDTAFCSVGYRDLMRQALDQMDEDDILLDYDHWINAQDYSENLSAHAAKIENFTDSTAIVKVAVRNFGRDGEVVLSMRYERDDWYVDDFLPSDEVGEGEKEYFIRMVCTVLAKRLILNDYAFYEEPMTKYAHVDIDGDGYDELWLRSANDKLGAIVSVAAGAQLLITERSPQKLSFYPGTVVVEGPCGLGCHTVNAVIVENSRKAHNVQYIKTNPLGMEGAVHEYFVDGTRLSTTNGKKRLQLIMHDKRQITPAWHDFRQEE